MSGKHEKALRVDRRVEPNFAAGDLPTAIYLADDLAPPAPPTLAKPTNLQLTTYLTRSAQAGMALIAATWDMLVNGAAADSFTVQASTSPSFTTDTTRSLVATDEAAAIANLKTNTLYYVRVQAIYKTIYGPWSSVASITTPQDLVAPAAVLGVAWQWLANGDLVLTWIGPDSENYKDAEARIYTSSAKTLQLRTLTGRHGVTYTAAMNYADTGNVPVTSVYVEVASRSYSNVYGPVALPPNQPSKDAPATPSGLTSSWAGDDGTAAAVCTISWTGQSDAIRYRLTIDGIARELAVPRMSYDLDTNISEHSGTADPSLALTLLAIDGLGQVSRVAASGYAVNARPPATTLRIAPGFSTIGVALTPSAAADLKDYRLRIVKDGQTAGTQRTADPNTPCDISPYGAGSYQIGVSVVDVFEQVSTETLSAAVLLEPLTIADLRVDAGYDDDMTSSPTALTTLKDTLTSSGGVFYP